MKFAGKVWKLLVGIKDGLVLVFMLLFFGMLYAALAASPYDDSVVAEIGANEQWTFAATGNTLTATSPMPEANTVAASAASIAAIRQAWSITSTASFTDSAS